MTRTQFVLFLSLGAATATSSTRLEAQVDASVSIEAEDSAAHEASEGDAVADEAAAVPADEGPAARADAARSATDAQPTPGARARLIVFQMVHGGLVGGELCGLAGCDEVRGGIGSVLAGMGVGAGVAALATRRHGVSPGSATLYDTAPLVGSLLAYEVFAATARRRPTSADDQRTTFLHGKALLGSLVGGQIGSYAIAAGLDRGLDLSAGDVIVGESAAIWLTGWTAMALWDLRGFGDNAQVRRAHAGYLVATLGGLAGGGALAHHYGVTPGRAMVANAGGFVGGGLGFLVTFFAFGDDLFDHRHAVAWSLVGGSLGGLALTLALTPALDERARDRRPVSLSLAPAPGGLEASLAMTLR